MYNKEWYEDDRPRDLSKYLAMTKEERQAEIAKLEAEEADKNKKQVIA